MMERSVIKTSLINIQDVEGISHASWWPKR